MERHSLRKRWKDIPYENDGNYEIEMKDRGILAIEELCFDRKAYENVIQNY